MTSHALFNCFILFLGALFVISMGTSAAALFAWGTTRDDEFFRQFIQATALLFFSCGMLTYFLYFV